MRCCKTRTRALLLCACLLLFAGPAHALVAQPAAGNEVAPGDRIAYAYTLPNEMNGCVLRLSLGPGLFLQEDSVSVQSKRESEVIFGSDGFVIMADRLDAGDSISFSANVSSSALEIWASLYAGDESIAEEEGYAAHILVLPAEAAQDAATLSQGAGETPDAGHLAVDTTALLLPAGLAAIFGLGLLVRRVRALGQRRAGTAPEAGAANPAPPMPATPDHTVEYLTLPEEAPPSE